jgi:hypothetical protein
MSDKLVSLIRTFVPVGVGALLAFLASKAGLVLDENSSAALTAGVTGLCVAGYYVVARVLEGLHPWFGVLLGSTRQPTYQAEHSR